MSTFKGFQGRNGHVVVLETASGREMVIPAHERIVRGQVRLFDQGWGDEFESVEEVYQTGFDILCAAIHDERLAAIFCKSFANRFLMDCGSAFVIPRKEVLDWIESKKKGVAA